MSPQDNTFFSNKVQEIHATPDGKITHSSNTIFTLVLGENIYDEHPFFESLREELNVGKETSLAFPCVQLEMYNNVHICDITIKKERGFLAILLFDYSKHYEHLHEAAQEKKTAMLNEQAHELNSKYADEKKVYHEYIQGRIDSKIITELEEIVWNLKKLKKTELMPEQLAFINSIEKKIVALQVRAVQIKEGVGTELN
jgi:hypothetical protein